MQHSSGKFLADVSCIKDMESFTFTLDDLARENVSMFGSGCSCTGNHWLIQSLH